MTVGEITVGINHSEDYSSNWGGGLSLSLNTIMYTTQSRIYENVENRNREKIYFLTTFHESGNYDNSLNMSLK